MEDKYAFIVFNLRTKTVNLEIFEGINAMDALGKCAEYYTNKSCVILSQVKIPKFGNED